MTPNQPQLFDRKALELRRKRAKSAPTDFLRDAAIDDVQERLEEVNRTFKSVAIVGPRSDKWQDAFPTAIFVEDQDTLPFSEASFDLVAHDLNLHWANDPVGQLVQCRRALRPDGLFLGTLFGGQTLNELRSTLAQAEVDCTGGLSPRVAPMAEIRDLGGLLQRAGFALPVADGQNYSVSYQNVFHLIADLRGMAETNVLAERTRTATPKQVFEKAAQIYAENFPAEGNRIQATFELITLTGWAPADTQPKALRPGSASNRLSEALGVVEKKL